MATLCGPGTAQDSNLDPVAYRGSLCQLAYLSIYLEPAPPLTTDSRFPHQGKVMVREDHLAGALLCAVSETSTGGVGMQGLSQKILTTSDPLILALQSRHCR